MKIIFILFFFAYVATIEYPKNINIVRTEKYDEKRSEDIEDLELLQKKLIENKENSIIVFHADWCHHW